jgi:hypothetical protein
MEADGGIHMEQTAVLLKIGLSVCFKLPGIIKVQNDWSYEQSDHASLYVKM